jgi:hypothetical protein
MRCYFRVAIMVFFLGGCIPYSDKPLTVLSPEALDPGIQGTWYVSGDGETVFLHVGTSGTPKRLRLAMIERDEDGGIKTSELCGHTSRFGGRNYLNLQWDEPIEQQKGFLFVKYAIIGEKLGIALIRATAVKKVVQAGGLEGVVEEGQWTSSVKLTDSPERLRAFFEKNDEDLFDDMKYLNRFIPSTTFYNN